MTPRMALAVGLALLLAGCGLDMGQQRKFKTYEPSKVWANGTSARPLPHGVVDQNALARDQAAANPPPVDDALLARGQRQYRIFCTPCHGLDGSGDGIIVEHGFPHPPSFASDKLLAMKAKDIYDVITHGYGVMYSYADRVPPQDRWAIIAYIRALQLSHHAKLADFPGAREMLP